MLKNLINLVKSVSSLFMPEKVCRSTHFMNEKVCESEIIEDLEKDTVFINCYKKDESIN
jgi:hypothetical protein